MTSSDWAQLLVSVCGTIVIVMRQRGYVTVDEYRTKTAALHNEANDLKVRVAVLEERAKK